MLEGPGSGSWPTTGPPAQTMVDTFKPGVRYSKKTIFFLVDDIFPPAADTNKAAGLVL